ncbi:hypothetical protein NLG97_g9147 [Lecanicillium saksenae]|uniref:Uncharacterized protein n=1 Tax=Lecanicillium saksenae TaxID=468837 RepID=A0ACC1QK67_9HYPO|nr:hypothetical protein NLG97_g9147 [Lecanicillium saksenae]
MPSGVWARRGVWPRRGVWTPPRPGLDEKIYSCGLLFEEGSGESDTDGVAKLNGEGDLADADPENSKTRFLGSVVGSTVSSVCLGEPGFSSPGSREAVDARRCGLDGAPKLNGLGNVDGLPCENTRAGLTGSMEGIGASRSYWEESDACVPVARRSPNP